jgi:hypothetical protein
MAASVYVPSSSSSRLAPVIPLRRGDRAALFQPSPQVEVEPTPLRLVVAGPARRPRIGVVASAVVAVALAVGLTLGATAVSAPAPTVGTHVVLQPGETLWDVAVRSAPPGVDARRQLADIRRLNGFQGGAIEAWTVVLLPA